MIGFITLLNFMMLANSQFSLSNTGQSLSSSFTLDSNVNYYFNFTLNRLITSGSIVKLTFPA